MKAMVIVTIITMSIEAVRIMRPHPALRATLPGVGEGKYYSPSHRGSEGRVSRASVTGGEHA